MTESRWRRWFHRPRQRHDDYGQATREWRLSILKALGLALGVMVVLILLIWLLGWSGNPQ